MATLPAVIFQFAMSPYDDWHRLAWAGALLVTATVLTLSHHRPPARNRNGIDLMEAATIAPVAGDNAKVDIRDLSFFYGATKALKNITLPLYDRKVTAFIGPSGCGKSTLLRVINRIYELYPNQRAEGDVMLDGENILKVKDLNLLRARVGMVFQKPTPFPMTIYDNVAFGIKLYERMPRSELDGRIEDALNAPRCGARSRTSCTHPGFPCRAASSSGCASRAPWRRGRK